MTRSRSNTNGATHSGTLYCVGLGPGDPELMTLKSARILSAAKNVAYFHKRGKRGNARTIADGMFSSDALELPMEYPITTEACVASVEYQTALTDFYDEKARDLSQRLLINRILKVNQAS